MAIPPVPSQEVAKLVLGYLAEEHLMTAYDEFLQASPYLDAFSNEYGRVFMTSLKNILAEFMAVKIYVETCKPIALRRKLMQCTNLLEVVKLLTALVDTQKLNYQDKPRIHKQNVISRVNSCDVCNSSGLLNCTCNSVHSSAKTQTSCNTEVITDTSVEATSLADLPGNAVVREDIPKAATSPIPNLQKRESNSIDSSVNQTIGKEVRKIGELNLNNVTSSTSENNIDVRCHSQSTPILMAKPDVSHKNIEEFDNILSIVTKQSSNSKVFPNPPVFNTGTFKEFSDGVEGKTQTRISPSPTAELHDIMSYGKNANSNTKDVAKEIISMPSLGMKDCNTFYTDEKHPEQRIKILSDIKVDNPYSKMPPILKSTTSTPLVQMKTLYINGTVAYKNNMQTGTNYNYTKDEIMAMPTFILVPSSGPPESPHIVIPKTKPSITKQNLDADTKCSTPRILKPLTIDVKTSRAVTNKDIGTKDLSLDVIERINEVGLIKTVDLTTASLPKETTASSLNKPSTPSIVPAMKKSSSTPRRTSHIRVLDFTTPRRILNESDEEKDNSNNTNLPQPHISCTPNPTLSQIPHSTNSSKSKVNSQAKDNIDKTKDENIYNKKLHNRKTKDIPSGKKTKSVKNWDADLRASLGAVDYQSELRKGKSIEAMKMSLVSSKAIKPDKKNISSSKVKDIKKTKVAKSSKNKKEEKKNTTPISNSKKSKDKPVERDLEVMKPTINIISLDAKCETPVPDSDNNPIQVINDIEQSDTPESERQALQNVIGAKLNISDLLETPYKQALYDIQMDTPRFLGPDLPDEPMSDIKIMNIPTPRFFDTPKLTQATPSTYSSRQTDYSSGGSYYKPDDQDYIPIDEVLECAITIAEDSNSKAEVNKNNLEEVHERPKRPVRNCTKNVSYRRKYSLNNKGKEDSKLDTASSLTDDNNHCTSEKKPNKKVLSKPRKTNKTSVSSKGEKSFKNPKVSLSKIELPRTACVSRKSSIKESGEKRIRKSSDSSKHLASTDMQPKTKTTKENIVNYTTENVAAPTKSRRKSATPRKLHCTKSFNSDSSGNISSNSSKSRGELTIDIKALCHQDSDSEHVPLRWSDDGSQDSKSKETKESSLPQNEEEDIDNIKKYIESCSKIDGNRNRQDNNLIFDSKRSFDAETAKIIERDLLGTPPRVAQSRIEVANNEDKLESVENIQSNKSESNSNNKNTSEDTDEEEDVELTVSDCNEGSKNYFSIEYDETKFVQNNNIPRLKDKYCIELCIEDDISIRLNATALSTVFEQDPGDSIVDENYFNETAKAVGSISNIDKLYTPMKNARNQCLEIFDSTLTSLDTPLKNDNSQVTEHETPLTEIVLEIENMQGKDKGETKKRKRNHSFVNEPLNNKKKKPETQDLLKSANIQNMDIESVLSKLHGP